MDNLILLRPALAADEMRITKFRRRIGSRFIKERTLEALNQSITQQSTFIAQHFTAGRPDAPIVGCLSLFYPGGEEPHVRRHSETRSNLREEVRHRERAACEFGSLLLEPAYEGLALGSYLGSMAIVSAHLANDPSFDLYAVVDKANEAPRGLLGQLGFETWQQPALPGSAKPDKDYFRFGGLPSNDKTPQVLRPCAKNLLKSSLVAQNKNVRNDGQKGNPTGPPYTIRYDFPLLDTPFQGMVYQMANGDFHA